MPTGEVSAAPIANERFGWVAGWAEASKFPAVGRKKLAAAFDGRHITSDGGVLLFGAVERRLGIAAKWRG